MIKIKFKKCCERRRNRDSYIEKGCNSHLVETTVIVGCKHEKVCKEYQESEEKEI